MPPQRGGRPLNQLVVDNFQQIIISERLATVQCRHCHKIMASGATRQQVHLGQCDQYRRTRPTNSDHRLIQTTFDANIRSLAVDVARRLHQTAAMAVYMFNLPFNHYENFYVRAHEQAFHSNYTPPSHTAMAEVLLNEAYQNVKAKVNPLLFVSHLNFFSGETCNIRKKRVINLCVHVSKTATSTKDEFHLKAKAEVAETMNAKTQARWLFNAVDDVLKKQFWRMNCFATDTCATMRALWSELEAFDQLKHVFFVPCDSHELQLLLDDILKLPWFTEVLEGAQWIARSFLAALKELTILWKFQTTISINLFFWLEDTRCSSVLFSPPFSLS